MYILSVVVSLLPVLISATTKQPIVRERVNPPILLSDLFGITADDAREMAVEGIRYTNAYTWGRFSDSDCSTFQVGYYVPLDICVDGDSTDESVSFKASWSASSSNDISSVNTISMTTYSKNKCRGTASSGMSESATSVCTYSPPPVWTYMSYYYMSLFGKSSVSIVETGVVFYLNKDVSSCDARKPSYHISELAYSAYGECFPAAGFAGGIDVEISSSNADGSFNYFYYPDSTDGSCSGTYDLTTYEISSMCSEQTSLSGHSYGYMWFLPITL